MSKRVLEEDPFHLSTMPIHVVSLVELEKKNVVFCVAQKLFNAYPNEAVSWFAAGCYYYSIKRYEHARRFLHKAKSLDHSFAPAWIAYGHAFAHHDESDQALAAYRTASRLFPGSHLPWLFIGLEYVRTNSLQLAQQFLESARTLMPTDAHVYNELGVVAFHRRNYSQACEFFARALRLAPRPEESFCSNLGHAYLKVRAFDRALEAFNQAHRLAPRNASVLAGLAHILQLQGQIEEAIEHYHRALSLNRDDVFSAEMLSYAVQEAADIPLNPMEF
jgi:anaphase-promoting complex subunit 6